MRIAIQTYGQIRCAEKCNHIQNFLETFGEIFNSDNIVDFFILTYKDNQRGLEYLKNTIGDSIKCIEYVEDMPEEARNVETMLINSLAAYPNSVTLEEAHISHRISEIEDSLDLLNRTDRWTASINEDLEILKEAQTGSKIIPLTKHKFGHILFHRLQLVNKMQNNYSSKNGIHYDWVISIRFFDLIYRKINNLNFIKKPSDEYVAYYHGDSVIISSQKQMSRIFDIFAKTYPIIGYEQWYCSEFKRQLRVSDLGLYNMPTTATLSPENQIFYRILSVTKYAMPLHAALNTHQKIFDKSAYFTFTCCQERNK